MPALSILFRSASVAMLLAAVPVLHHAAGETWRQYSGMQAEHAHAHAHGDHAARHGGQLGMAGDFHLEFVVRERSVEVHVSDAWRRPLKAVRGTLDYGDGIERPLRWHGTFLRGPYVRGAESVNARVMLDSGRAVEIEFWLADGES